MDARSERPYIINGSPSPVAGFGELFVVIPDNKNIQIVGSRHASDWIVCDVLVDVVVGIPVCRDVPRNIRANSIVSNTYKIEIFRTNLRSGGENSRFFGQLSRFRNILGPYPVCVYRVWADFFVGKYFYERLAWKPVSERVSRTKRARLLGAFRVRWLTMRDAASGSLATM